MSDARDELFEALMPTYRSQYAPGEEESTNALLDAYRAEVLREAAKQVETISVRPEIRIENVRFGMLCAAELVRLMADEGNPA